MNTTRNSDHKHLSSYMLQVLVLGAAGCGKTSLVQTLVDQQSRLTTAEEVTSGIDMYDLSLEVEPEAPEVTEKPPDEPPPPSPIAKEPVKKLTKKRSRSTVKRKERLSVDSEDNSRASSRVTRKSSPEKKVVVDEPVEPPAEGEEAAKEPEVPEKRSLNLAVWDFSGNSQYLYSSYIFLQQPSLVWLVFDLSTYEDERFAETLGCWIDWIIAKTNHFVAIIVGTQVDKLRPKNVTEICEKVGEKIKQHLQNHNDLIEREIKKIESKPHISPALSEQLKRYIALKKMEPRIFPQVVPVSAKAGAEMENLMEATKSMAMDKTIFPEVLKVIPSLWANVEYYIEDKGYGLQVGVCVYAITHSFRSFGNQEEYYIPYSRDRNFLYAWYINLMFYLFLI
jgi:GTPase SAR1 family protein